MLQAEPQQRHQGMYQSQLQCVCKQILSIESGVYMLMRYPVHVCCSSDYLRDLQPRQNRDVHLHSQASLYASSILTSFASQVSQLAGYVSEHSAYHHGDVSLTSTIVGMAQNFVGSNNINLLYPSGAFQLCLTSACALHMAS